MGDDVVRVKASVAYLLGDISAPEERTGKVGESLAVCLVSARSVEPLRDRVRAMLVWVVIERHGVSLQTARTQTPSRSFCHVRRDGSRLGTHPA
jgi:hypothetical protein